jgi:hypothetical protein
MSSRDWEKELAAIDRQLASVPDEALVRNPAAVPQRVDPGARPAVAAPRGGAPAPPGVPARRWRSTAGLLVRLLIGLAGVAALAVWPYDVRCGSLLAGYLAVTAAVALAGVWTSVAAWRHRAPLVHLVGLALVVTGGVFAAREVLPRVGYALPTPEHPAIWFCQ